MWPDQTDRFERLRAALAIAADDRASTSGTGDAVADTAALGRAAGAHPVVTNTWVLNYLSAPSGAPTSAALDELGGARDVSWVFAESPVLVPELPVADRHSAQTAVVLVRWRGGSPHRRPPRRRPPPRLLAALARDHVGTRRCRGRASWRPSGHGGAPGPAGAEVAAMGSCGDPLERVARRRRGRTDGAADGSSRAARSNDVASKSTSLTTTLSQSRAAAPGATGRPAGSDAGIGSPDPRGRTSGRRRRARSARRRGSGSGR